MSRRVAGTALAVGVVLATLAPVVAQEPLAAACAMHEEHDGPHERVSCGLERLGAVEVSAVGGLGQLQVRGDLAAVVQRDDGDVALVDVADPADPRVLGRYDGGTGRPELDEPFDGDVAFSADGRHVFYARQTHNFSNDGLHVVDVTEPAAPRRATYVPAGGTLRVASHVDATGEYVVTLDAVAGLTVFRFDPTTAALVPVHVDALPALKVGGPASAGLHVDADDPVLGIPLLYVATGRTGLQVFDFSSPATPRRLGAWSTSGLADIAVRADSSGRTVYAASEYWFQKRTPPQVLELDATDVAAIRERRRVSPGGWDVPGGPEWRVQGLTLGPLGLYVAQSHAGLGVLDLADLDGPVIASTTDLGEGNPGGEFPSVAPYAMDVEVVGDVLYVTDASTGRLTMFRELAAR
jgi:hypothetical protein